MFNIFFKSNSILDTTNATLPPIHYETEFRLNSIKCCELEICDILKSLDPNKASGADGIRMLKYTASSIYPSLTRLFNISLEKKIYPSVWKNANVTLLYKKGDASLLTNYRPISILSAVSKVMEKAIFKHTFNFIRDNNLLHTLQSDCMPGHSTTHQLVHLYHVFSEALDNKQKGRLVFGDISKAFDRVWHAGVIHKLNNFGITGELNSWFSSYLFERKQRVVLDGFTSSYGGLQAGVPQGSVLGPLLFLIFL